MLNRNMMAGHVDSQPTITIKARSLYGMDSYIRSKSIPEWYPPFGQTFEKRTFFVEPLEEIELYGSSGNADISDCIGCYVKSQSYGDCIIVVRSANASFTVTL